MNDRYGVDPCAASTALELAFLLRQFGPEHGRFIVNFPSDWHAHVGMQYPGAGDIERARLTELLRRAKRSLLPTNTRYSSALPWVKNAEHLKEVQGLIGPIGSKPPCRAVADVLSDPDALPDCRGGHIPRTPVAYADVARPLFQISTKVVLIDPYFQLRYRDKYSQQTRSADRYVRSLKALIRAAQAEKVEIFKLMVTAGQAMIDVDDGKVFEADLAAILSDVGGSDIVIEYGLLDKEHSLDRHPRYLLGNECGLKFDWGLDVRNDNSTNHVEWMGRAALTPLIDRFMQAVAL